MSDIEDTAISAVAGAVANTPHRIAMASAIMRIAGNAFAKFLSHEEAWKRHTELARWHFQRMGRGR